MYSGYKKQLGKNTLKKMSSVSVKNSKTQTAIV